MAATVSPRTWSQLGPAATAADVSELWHASPDPGPNGYPLRWLRAVRLADRLGSAFGTDDPIRFATFALNGCGETAILRLLDELGIEAGATNQYDFMQSGGEPIMQGYYPNDEDEIRDRLTDSKLAKSLASGQLRPPSMSGLRYIPAALTLRRYGLESEIRFGNDNTFNGPLDSLKRNMIDDESLTQHFPVDEAAGGLEYVKRALRRPLSPTEAAAHVVLSEQHALLSVGHDVSTWAATKNAGQPVERQRGRHMVLALGSSRSRSEMLFVDPKMADSGWIARAKPLTELARHMPAETPTSGPRGILVRRAQLNSDGGKLTVSFGIR